MRPSIKQQQQLSKREAEIQEKLMKLNHRKGPEYDRLVGELQRIQAKLYYAAKH